jgi:hypothetical protein
LPQGSSFFDERDPEPVCSGDFQSARHRYRAVAVGVAFDGGEHTCFWADRSAHLCEILLQTLQVNACYCGAHVLGHGSI